MTKVPVKPDLGVLHADILRVWRTLDADIMTRTEEQCWALLEVEKTGKARRLFLQRIYGRASRLRASREIYELRRLFSDNQA